MTKSLIAIRNVDKDAFCEFRALIIEKDMTVGDGVTAALKAYLKAHGPKKPRRTKLHYLDEVKPCAFSKCPED